MNEDTVSARFGSWEAVRSAGGLSSSTCTSLIGLVRIRDAEAWRRLVRVYSPLVYRWCRNAGVAADDTPDVVQEVFASVLQSLDHFHDTGVSGSFRAWLRGITRHRVLDHFRRRRATPPAQGGTGAQAVLHQVPAAGDPPDIGEESEADDSLWHRALELVRAEFTDRTWQAFWLAGVERRVPAHVALDLGISVAAVYQAKSRVLRRLREELDGLEPA